MVVATVGVVTAVVATGGAAAVVGSAASGAGIGEWINYLLLENSF